MTLKCVSFPFNKTGEIRTPILCPNMNKIKVENGHAGKCASYVTCQ